MFNVTVKKIPNFPVFDLEGTIKFWSDRGLMGVSDLSGDFKPIFGLVNAEGVFNLPE